jgi:hypothetical protein
MFRGLHYEPELEKIKPPNPKLIYVVDAERMERSESYQELVRSSALLHHRSLRPLSAAADVQAQVYRELHGVLGEGKGRFESGLAVALHLLNTTNRTSIIKRLKARLSLGGACKHESEREAFVLSTRCTFTRYHRVPSPATVRTTVGPSSSLSVTSTRTAVPLPLKVHTHGRAIH